MTIIEREQVVHRDVERERRASLLEAAALEIEVRGWCQGAADNQDGNVCMMTAMLHAEGTGPHTSGYLWERLMRAWDPCWPDAFGFASETELLPLAAWNDCRAESAADVTFVLRWRAQEIRDGR